MMKRLLFLLTALLTLSVGMWAQTQSVTYIDENGVAQTATATEVHNSTTTLNAGWYVVTGTDVQTGSLTCYGEVHLILADGAKLTATGGAFKAGIQVSGEGNSLSIYGQDAQSGILVATGGFYAAGIGSREDASGSNITINGGMVTATGGFYAAGIGGGFNGSGSNITINGGTVSATGGQFAAGIGGGVYGSGSHITINGGTVTATGGYDAVGIGGGVDASSSDIIMPVNYRIKAGGTFIHNDGTDLADSLAGKQNVEAYPDELLNERNAAFAAISAAVEDISNETILAMAAAAMEAVFQAEFLNDINIVLAKINAIAEITTAREGIQNEFFNLWIDAAITDINKPGTDTEEKVNNIRDKISELIEAFQEGKTEGKAEAAAELLGSMGEPCTGCPAVEIFDDNTTIKLYNPKKVEFMKNQSEE